MKRWKGRKAEAIRKVMLWCLILAGFWFLGKEDVQAATSYTNAREFYESTGRNNFYHAQCYDGNIYYATMARLASADGNLKYYTLGFDVTLSGNGQAVSFSVKRDSSLQEVAQSRVRYGGYEYLLYQVSRDKLYELARIVNPAAAAGVLSSSRIDVCLDAILTIKKGTKLYGNITENGSGGLMEAGMVYHLKKEGDLLSVKRAFLGHEFSSYIDIYCLLENYTLSIGYKLEGGNAGKGYSVKDDVLYQNGSPVITRSKVLEKVQLINPAAAALTKTGYHIVQGKEWTYNNQNFSHTSMYMPYEICAVAGIQDENIYVSANWAPNTYTVVYNTNGAKGIFADQTMNYGEYGKVYGACARDGYVFQGWRCEDGRIYKGGETFINLSEKDGDIVTMTAQWKAAVYTIATDRQGGTGGTGRFYEKYADGWYSDSKLSEAVKTVTVPQKKGYKFKAYYTGMLGYGEEIVNAKGKIVVSPDYFLSDSIIYALWEPAKYVVTFDKQGGTGGRSGDNQNDTMEVSYMKSLPNVPAPVKEGYSFCGYFTQPNGKGIKYYNETMVGQLIYKEAGDITLYACWVDDIAPEITLRAVPGNWYNGSSTGTYHPGQYGIKITGKAVETGSGLKKVILYQGNEAKDDKRVAEDSRLTGILEYINRTEGALPYTILAIDHAGNMAEARTTAYYDIKAPNGNVITKNHSGTLLELEMFVTDYNIP